jgi:YidC/Oxa1 family membrane protein insertase
MWRTFFIQPITNLLVFFVGIFGGSVGLGIIALTILIKIILAPLAAKSIRYQLEQQKLQPLIKKIQSDYPDRKEQSQKLMELYKEHKSNPFAGIIIILIQLPIVIALYQVILGGVGASPDLLYSFVHIPEHISSMFLGFHLAEKSIVLGILAGLTQFIQLWMSPSQKIMKVKQTPKNPSEKPSAEDIAQSMQKSMLYTMPVMIAVISTIIPSAVSLYLVMSNLATIIQEFFIMKKLKREGIL